MITERERNELTGIIASGRSEYAYDTAARILAAGYRKPRTVSSVDELDTLPDGSVVLDAERVIRERYTDDDTKSPLWAGNRGYILSYRFPLPGVVLHVEDAE